MAKFLFRQVVDKKSSTLTYFLGCKETKEMILIDGVLENMERDVKYAQELGMEIKALVETHVHAEHLAVVSKFQAKFPVPAFYGVNTGVDTSVVKNVKLVKEGDKIGFGNLHLECYETPGHTSGCMSYHFPGKKFGGTADFVFTGDCMFVRKCGRTDFQQGSARTMHQSINKLYRILDDDCFVYPGHDYSGFTCSTIGEEKEHSIRVNGKITEEEFEVMMKDALATLANPMMLHLAVAANLNGGIVEAQHMHSNFYVMGTLTPMAIRLAKKKHDIRTIIWIVTPQTEGFFDAGPVCKESGINYFHHPMTPATVSNQKLLEFCKMVEQLPGNFVISCTTENRSRFLAYYYAKYKKVENVDWDKIIFGVKSEPMKKYLVEDIKEDIGEYLFSASQRGAKPSDVCEVGGGGGGNAHSECGM